MQETSTRSPTSSVVTAEPTSTTVPTASWPRIVPGVTSGTSPFRMCRAVPQIVETSMWTIASVGSRISGSGTSSQARSPGPGYTSAYIVPPWCDRSDRWRDAHTLPELEEPGRIAPFVVVPGDDLRLRAVDHGRQPPVD